MRIRKLAPSGRVEGRWLCHLEDGTILRLGESEVVAFGLGTGKELSGAELSALTEAARAARVREKAVELLSARPLSRKELVEKLTARPRNREKEPLLRPGGRRGGGRLAEGAGLSGRRAVWPARWRSTVLPRATVPAASGRSSTAGGCRGTAGTALWRGCPARRRPSTPFCRRSCGGRSSPIPRCAGRAADALARRGYRWEDISAGLRRYGAEPEEW